MALQDDIKSYIEKYSHIPDNKEERFKFILCEYKINNKDLLKLNEYIKKLIKPGWKSFKFSLWLIPKPTPRPRFSRKTKRFFVKDAANYSSLFKEFIESIEDRPELIVTPCKFYLDAYLPIPSSGMNKHEKILSELKLIRPISTPDFDNLAKTYSDMLQNHLLLNDSLIVESRQRKFYSRKPRIEVNIEYLEKFESNYNKKKVEDWKYYKNLGEEKPDIKTII